MCACLRVRVGKSGVEIMFIKHCLVNKAAYYNTYILAALYIHYLFYILY